MTKANDIRDLSVEELEAKHEDMLREIFELRNELVTSKKLEKPHRIPELRKDVARVLTILKEKQMAKGATNG